MRQGDIFIRQPRPQKLIDAELGERKTKITLRGSLEICPASWARRWTVTDPGGAHEKQCYADI